MSKSRLLLMACAFLSCNTESLAGNEISNTQIEEYLGKFKVRYVDGKGKTEGKGDVFEAAIAGVISEDGRFKFEARCDAITRTRMDYFYKPKVRVRMWVSEYNPTTNRTFNSKRLIAFDESAAWEVLDNDRILNYGPAVSFDILGWKAAWNITIGYCYSGYNIYIQEWNKKKGTNHQQITDFKYDLSK